MSEAPNPYQSAATADGEPARQTGLPLLWALAAAPWVLLAVAVRMASASFTPVYSGSDMPMPALTLSLLGIGAPITFFFVGCLVLITSLLLPQRQRRILGAVSFCLAALVGVICVWGFRLPFQALP